MPDSQNDILSGGEENTPLQKRVTLRNIRGLHARAASKFATLAQSFNANIEVTSINDVCRETVEGDSIMELLLLGSACGEDICICASGPEAEIALEALSTLVKDRFGEKE